MIGVYITLGACGLGLLILWLYLLRDTKRETEKWRTSNRMGKLTPPRSPSGGKRGW